MNIPAKAGIYPSVPFAVCRQPLCTLRSFAQDTCKTTCAMRVVQASAPAWLGAGLWPAPQHEEGQLLDARRLRADLLRQLNAELGSGVPT